MKARTTLWILLTCNVWGAVAANSSPDTGIDTQASPLPPSIALIIGTRASDHAKRVQAVHELGDKLSATTIAALYRFIKSPPAAAEPSLCLSWLKNDVLNALREQEIPPLGFTKLLIQVYKDSAQDIVMRDYAIQHLIVWYAREGSVEGRAQILGALREAAIKQNSIAGTALLGWHRLSQMDGSIPGTEIDQCALSKVRNSDNATRLTAIQVCAERGLPEALPYIEPLIGASDCVPLGLSAATAAQRLRNLRPTVAMRDRHSSIE